MSDKMKNLVVEEAKYRKSLSFLETDEKAKALRMLLESPDENTDFQKISVDALKDLEDRAKCVPFIDDKFVDFIQLGPRSLALILAQTGTGKTTISANIAARLIKDGKKVLIIANEETDSDIILRVYCLLNGFNIHKYKSVDSATCYPLDIKKQIIEGLNTLEGSLEVRGLNYKGNSDIVTSLEGTRHILEQSINKYDTIIIDYYQNISQSIRDTSKDVYTVQHEFGLELDKLKHKLGCPVIMFAQCSAGKDSYKARIEGRKSVLNRATDIFEFAQNKGGSTSFFMCHKNRWLPKVNHLGLMDYKEGKLELLSIHETISDAAISQMNNVIDKQLEEK